MSKSRYSSIAMGSRFLTMAFAIAAVLSAGAACFASIQLEFDDVIIQGGTVSYDGAGGSLVGTDIVFDLVKGIGTPANDGTVLSIVDGLLNFTSGANLSEGPAVWSFAGGGTFTLTGEVYDGATLVASGVLLSGSFLDEVFATGSGQNLIVAGFGMDEKNQDLLDFFEIGDPNQFEFANTEISLGGATIGSDGSFSASVVDADLVNMQIPEATTIVVWSVLSMFGVAAYRRCRVNLS